MNKLKPLNKLSSLHKSSSAKTKRAKIFKISTHVAKPNIVSKGRDYTYGPKWREFSTEVKQEFGDLCHVCHSRDEVELHHIIPLSKGGKNIRINMKPLCHKCHSKQHRHMR